MLGSIGFPDLRRQFGSKLSDLRNHYLIDNAVGGFRIMVSDPVTLGGLIVFLSLLILALIGPEITPYPYDQLNYAEDGSLARLEPPSRQHPLGTTQRGYDVLSRLIYGARPTIFAAMVGGTIAVGIGSTVGITAGYMGGDVETVLMRINDFMYGVPLIPFAIVLITFFDTSFAMSVLVIALVYWRVSSRVLRSQVLQIKQRPYIESAKAAGASTPRIIFKHIIPNIANMMVLWFALSAGYVVLYQAGLAFLGVVSPFVPSWGIMIRNAYNAGFVYDAWWWSLPPGLMISATVLSTFLVGRGYENITESRGDVT